MGPRLAALFLLPLAAAPALAQVPLPDSLTQPVPADSAAVAATRVPFHDFELRVPASEGWKLVGRASEDQSIAVELVWQSQGQRFKLGHIEVARLGLLEPGAARDPGVAFDTLAARELRSAQADVRASGGRFRWLDTGRDVRVEDGRTLRRLWYAVASADTRADAFVVYLFPESFARDGFFVRALLQMWSQPGREDLSILEDFVAVVRSIRPLEPEVDVRLVRDGPDLLGKARLSLPHVYYDYRARVLHSPHDTTRTACWTQVEDSVAVGLQPTVLPGALFFSLRERPPARGERVQGERFGKAFDRDGDGRFDLAYFSQGWARGQDHRTLRTFYVVADDDGDGRVDGVIYEDGDNSRDGRVDHAIFAQDRGGGGVADRAWVFDADIAHPVRPVPHEETIFLMDRLSRPGDERADLGREFRDWSAQLARLNRAGAACRREGSARR